MKKTVLIILLLVSAWHGRGQEGYDLWMNYKPLDKKTSAFYQPQFSSIYIVGNDETVSIAAKELSAGLKQLIQNPVAITPAIKNGSIVIGTATALQKIITIPKTDLDKAGEEGFIIVSKNIAGKKCIVIAGNKPVAVLYGAFHLLRVIQSGTATNNFQIISTPRIKLRVLNHWDNLDRSVERGYAGLSIWNWHHLPGYKDKRYIDYARANASIGINGTVLTNVNSNALVLTKPWLEKVAALANIFRPYGIRVYLTARFSAPIEIGKLSTADPLNDSVKKWWTNKATEIYSMIPDFGGFLVKANSEGQPGPQNYGRNHTEGANMLADAVAPHNGIIMWRAFVYNPESDDRFKQAFNEFNPLDGKFRKNVMVQVKNGPIDFQPREPFSPLFGSMPQTPLMMEFQLTQEYLGQATHLVYEAPLFKEVLDADTYAKGKGSTVASVIDGKLNNHTLTGMAGVANIGNELNWTGHLFGQANWYALGRLAWDHTLGSEEIAVEWIRQTFKRDPIVVSGIKQIMLGSHEAMVNYMTPLGLHHIMGNGHHYGPAPWSNNLPRPDWNPVYYHRADSIGIGFDRTAKGSNALAQYHSTISSKYNDINTCDEKYLLWFHHVPWTHRMKSGKTLWDEMVHRYHAGVDSVKAMQQQWNKLELMLSPGQFDHVKMMLAIQLEEARWWRDACLQYFQLFSKMKIPDHLEKPAHTLDYYKQLRFPYAPGN